MGISLPPQDEIMYLYLRIYVPIKLYIVNYLVRDLKIVKWSWIVVNSNGLGQKKLFL